MTGRPRIVGIIMLAALLSAFTSTAFSNGITGNRWDSNLFPVPYTVNPDGAPPEFEALVQGCVEQWHQVGGSDLVFRYTGTTTRSFNNNDGYNSFTWDATGEHFIIDDGGDENGDDPEPMLLAITYVRTDGNGTILEADTIINGHESIEWSVSGNPASDEYDLETFILREVGRWIELEYLTDPSFIESVMYDPIPPDTVKNTLSELDRLLISEVYPAQYQIDIHEPDNSSARAHELIVNVPRHDHNIYPADDVDWFFFILTETQSVRIATSGEDPLGDTQMFLYQQGDYENPIEENDDPYDPPEGALPRYAIIEGTALPPGAYYVMVRSSSSQWIVPDYSIVLLPSMVDAYEYDDGRADGKRIYAGQPQTRSIYPEGDIDWAYFILSESSQVVIETSSDVVPDGDTFLRLLDEGGRELARNNDKTENDLYSMIEMVLEPGRYYISVREYWNYNIIESYQLNFDALVTIEDLYEPDNTPQGAKELALGEVQDYRSIRPIGDEDWVYVELDSFTSELIVETRGELGHDTFMEMYDSTILTNPGAQPLATDDNSGIGNYSMIACNDLSAGAYYFRVTQKDNDTVIHRYRIFAIATLGGDQWEPNNVRDYPTPIELGVPQEHSIFPSGDVDWVAFELPTGGAVTVETYGGDPDGDTEIWLYYEDETIEKAHNVDKDPLGWDYYSLIHEDPLPAGRYYLKVSASFYSSGYTFDQYFILVTFEEAEVDDYEPDDNTPGGATLLTSGVPSTQHSISPLADVDWYKIVTGDTAPNWDIEIHVNAGEEDYLLVQFYNHSVELDPDNGTLLANLYVYGSDLMRHVEMEPGTYYIKVSQASGQKIVDDYELTATLSEGQDFRTAPRWLTYSGNWRTPPPPKEIIVRHMYQTVNWTSQADPWVILTPDSGTVGPDLDQTVIVAVDPSYFPDRGTYYCTVTLTADNPEQQTTTFEVEFSVTLGAADIRWDKESLDFEGTEGSIPIPPQQITFTNHGEGSILPWDAEVVDAGGDPVLFGQIEPESGIIYDFAPSQELSITIDASLLAPGIHTVFLKLNGFDASPTGKPELVPITITQHTDTTPPTPDPAVFGIPPEGIAGTSKLTMTAIETTDDQLGQVEYYFEFLGGDSGGADSGWITSPTFELDNLVPGGYYTYRVRARDTSSQLNMTEFSQKASGCVAPLTPPAPVVSSPSFTTLDITPTRGGNSPRARLAIYNETDDCYVGRTGDPADEPVWRYQEEWQTITALKLRGSTVYSFRVIAVNDQGLQSEPSAAGIGITLDNMPPEPAPTLPDGHPYLNAEKTHVYMTATEAFDQTTPVQYRFEYTGSEIDGQSTGWQTSRSFSHSISVPGGKYSYRVKARDGNLIETEWSEERAAYLPAAAPAAPTQVGSSTDTTVTFTFVTSGNSSSVQYAIRHTLTLQPTRYVDEVGFLQLDIVWLTWDELTKGGTTVTAQGLLRGRSGQRIDIMARNGDGETTAWSPYTNFTTPSTPDTTPPAPNPMRWDAGSPLEVTTSRITVMLYAATDSTTPIRYQVENITTGQTVTQDHPNRTFVFSSLDAAARYEFRGRAFDSASPVHYTDWTPNTVIYTRPMVPGNANFNVIDVGEQSVSIEINPLANSGDAEYAVEISTNGTTWGTFIAADGTATAAGKVWKSRAEWLATELSGMAGGQVYWLRAYARNAQGYEADQPGAASASSFSFAPPTPDPAVLNSLTCDPQTKQITATAQPGNDPATVQYYFQSLTNEFPDSGWIENNVWVFNATTTATAAEFRVKYRNAGGIETEWSTSKSVNVPPVSPGQLILRARSNSRAYISIDPLLNSKNAQYSIRTTNVAPYHVQADGTLGTQEVWRTYHEWGEIVELVRGSYSMSWTVQAAVRQTGTTTPVELGSTRTILFLGTVYSTPPSPDSAFEGDLVPTDTTVTMTSVTVTASPSSNHVQYGFQREGTDIVWQWERTYVAEDLAPGTTYRFRTQARDAVGNANEPSSYVQVMTLPATPGAPAVAPGAFTAAVQLDAAGNNSAVQYAIYDQRHDLWVGSDKVLSAQNPAWLTIAQWGATINVTGLSLDQQYRFLVKARTTEDETPFGPGTSFSTRFEDGDPPTPDPAQIVSVTALSPTSFRAVAMQAEDASQPVLYLFTVASDEGDAYDSQWQESQIFEPDGLTPAGKYTVRVKVRDSSVYPQTNETQLSEPVEVYLHPVTPGAPVVSNVTTGSASLSFGTGNNSTEAAYAIRDSITGRYADASGLLVSLTPVWRQASQWSTPVSVTGLEPDRTYSFYVVARSNSGDVSPRSDETEATTLAGVVAPPAPSVSATASRGVRLHLNQGALPADTPVVIRVTGAAAAYVQADGTTGPAQFWRTFAQWGSTTCIRGLDSDTNYDIDVSADALEWSDAVQVLTNLLGDVNGDGVVDLLDLVAARNRQGEDPCASVGSFVADVDADGSIDAADLITVRNNLGNAR